MKGFLNLKIGVKLLAGFILVAIIAGAMGVFAIVNIKTLDEAGTELYEYMTVPIALMATISSDFQRSRVNIRDMLLADDPVEIADFKKRIDERRASVSELSKQFEDLIVSDEMRALYDEFLATRVAYGQALDHIVMLALANRDEEGFAALAEDQPAGIASRAEQEVIAAMVDMKVRDAAAKAAANKVRANTTMLTMVIVLVVVMALSILLGIVLSSIISKPLKKALVMIQEMGKGHLGMRLKMDTRDEVGQMAMAMDEFAESLQNVTVKTVQMIAAGDMSAKVTVVDDKDEISPALQTCIKAVNALVADANMLAVAAQEGRLDTRADASKHGGEFAKVVDGVNKTLDSVIGPLNVAAEYVDRISKGDIPPKITDKYNGDFNEIKNNLNVCIDAVNALVADAAMLTVAAQEGRLDTRADASKHGGDFRKIVEGVNKTLDSVIGPLNVAAEYVDRISKGDIPPKITDRYNGDFNEIKNNLNMCIDAMNQLIQEMGNMSTQHDLGDIDIKVNEELFQGVYRQMAAGVNTMVFGHIAVKKKAMACLAEFGNGNFEAQLERFPGKKVFINEIMEQVRANLKALIADANMLSIAAVEGRLDTRADASKHGGDFRKIVDGVNKTLDSVIGPLNVAAEYMDRISKGDIPTKITDKYNGDFNEIKNNINVCIDAVNALVADAAMLTVAAVEGKLSTRADATKHGGDFRKIVEGVNKTLDAVIKPVNEAASVLKEMAAGSLQSRVKGDYQGDHAEIKIALNSTLEALSEYVNEITSVLSEMANANIDMSITSDYRGDFSPIKKALNLILDSFNQTLSDINTAADQVAEGSSQVSDGSQQLSRGATGQASAVEQLTASINDIAEQTRQNAVNANKANELAGTAHIAATQGNVRMKELQKAMEEINDSSANISKIIKVIDEIAFQTNILALNAAVEAAHAGQHGKGFAVVAEEVRSLAARSASAAKETSSLIEGSIKKAESGTLIANDTAQALDRIVVDVAKAAELVGSIAAASNEQATGIAQINTGVEQVSKIVQANSATSEQSAQASEELSGQAELLKGMISSFHLRKTHGGTALAKRTPASRELAKGRADRKSASFSDASNKPEIILSDVEFGKY